MSVSYMSISISMSVNIQALIEELLDVRSGEACDAGDLRMKMINR